MTKKKLVRILDARPIFPIGGTVGPIMTPHSLDQKTISVLIMKGYNLEELLNDGSYLKLTTKNFDSDNNVIVTELKPEVAPDTTVETEAPKAEVVEPVVVDERVVDVEPIVFTPAPKEETKTYNNKFNKSGKNEKNKKQINIDSLQKK